MRFEYVVLLCMFVSFTRIVNCDLRYTHFSNVPIILLLLLLFIVGLGYDVLTALLPVLIFVNGFL